MAEVVLLTREGYEKIKEEYERHTSVSRLEVAERIKEARSFGDLSENAEYDAAKEEQAELEERINKLENMLRNAKIIEDDEAEVSDTVGVGNKVMLKNVTTGDTEEYRIVGKTEADPFEGRISNESAVGKAVLGNPVGSTVEVEVPDGKIHYEILEIEK